MQIASTIKCLLVVLLSFISVSAYAQREPSASRSIDEIVGALTDEQVEQLHSIVTRDNKCDVDGSVADCAGKLTGTKCGSDRFEMCVFESADSQKCICKKTVPTPGPVPQG